MEVSRAGDTKPTRLRFGRDRLVPVCTCRALCPVFIAWVPSGLPKRESCSSLVKPPRSEWSSEKLSRFQVSRRTSTSTCGYTNPLRRGPFRSSSRATGEENALFHRVEAC